MSDTVTGTRETSPNTTYLHVQMPLEQDKTCPRSTVDADLRSIGSAHGSEPALADLDIGEPRKMALNLLPRTLSFITESDGETDIDTDGEFVYDDPEYVSYKDIDHAPFYGRHIPDAPGFAMNSKQRDPPSEATSKKFNPAAPSFTFTPNHFPCQLIGQRPDAYALDPAVLSWHLSTYPTQNSFFPGWMQTPADSDGLAMAVEHSDPIGDPYWDNDFVPALRPPLPTHHRPFQQNTAGEETWASLVADADAPLPGLSPGHIASACGQSSIPSQDTRDDPPYNTARSTGVPLPKPPILTWAQVVGSQALQPPPVPSCPQQKWGARDGIFVTHSSDRSD